MQYPRTIYKFSIKTFHYFSFSPFLGSVCIRCSNYLKALQCARTCSRDDHLLQSSRLLEIQQDRKSRKLCPGTTNLVVLTSFAKIVYTKKNHAGGMKTILPGRVKYSFIVSTIKFDKQIGNYDVGNCWLF